MNTTTTQSELQRLLDLSIDRKSVVLAYVLWFFFGLFGVHRMYLGKVGTGIVMAALSVLGGLTAPILIGFIPLAVVGIWWLIDFFTIYFAARRYNAARDHLTGRL